MMKTTIQRFLFLIVLGGVHFTVYLLLNQRAELVPVQVTMPGWVPFLPWMAAPYLGMLVVPWFMPMALTNQDRFWRCIAAFVLGFVMTAAVWFFFPTEMPRPMVAAGWWNDLYREMIAVDRPVNILPCGHILAPVIATWFVVEERRRWWCWLVPALVIGSATIVTTWQHRPVDVLIGACIAVVAVGMARWLPPRGR